MIKKYILSIDQELKEYFLESIAQIKERVKVDVLGTPLISSNKIISSIVEKEMNNFIENSIAVFDYYTDGIYNSGKVSSRKKLKLEIEKPLSGERYSFNNNDKMFIERYKSIKLFDLNKKLSSAIGHYLSYLIDEKINGKWNINSDNDDYKHFEYHNQELVDDEMEDILKIIDNSIAPSYEEILEYIAREIIVLFKRAQLEEYKNLGIDTFVYLSNDIQYSCPVCNAKSGKIAKIDYFIDDFGLKDGTRHAFCKFKVDPVISYQNQITNFHSRSFSLHSEISSYFDSNFHLDSNIKTRVDFEIAGIKFINVPVEIEDRINSVIKQLQIYADKFIKPIQYKFVNNVSDLPEWVNSVEKHYIENGKNEFEAQNEALLAQDRLKFKVVTFVIDDTVYLSPSALDSQPIEVIVLREILKSSLKVDTKIEELYKKRKDSKHIGAGSSVYEEPFISYLAEESAFDYLLESAISYIINPQLLKLLDKEVYIYLKDELFDSIEFSK